MDVGLMHTVTIEHMIPQCQGGENHRWNLTAACHRCNSVRRHTDMHEFELISRRFGPDQRRIEDAAVINRRARRQRYRAKQRGVVNNNLTLRERLLLWMQGFAQVFPV